MHKIFYRFIPHKHYSNLPSMGNGIPYHTCDTFFITTCLTILSTLAKQTDEDFLGYSNSFRPILSEYGKNV